MKYCGTCELNKDGSEFHKRKASIDGLSAKCKLCQRVYDKLRSKDEHRVSQRAVYAQTEEGRLAGGRAKALYRKRNPEKTRAHSILNRHLRVGNITRKPCKVCGEEKTHAHHSDYSKPLDVEWLCAAHHKQEHERLAKAEENKS